VRRDPAGCLDSPLHGQFPRCSRPTPSPLTLSRLPAHPASTPSSSDSTTTVDSLDGSHASVPSVILASPFANPRLLSQSTFAVVVPRCLVCLVLSTWSVMPRSPYLVYRPCPPRDLLNAAATLLADSDDEVPIPGFPPRSALVLCYSDDEVLILSVAACAFLSVLQFPSLCSPWSCPVGLWPRPMPSWIWLMSICFFVFHAKPLCCLPTPMRMWFHIYAAAVRTTCWTGIAANDAFPLQSVLCRKMHG
jgi:hypothetical protein